MLINFSVWESRDALWSYIYRSEHLEVHAAAAGVVRAAAEPHLVMWWIPEGTIPTLPEAMERLRRLRTEGPSPEAFTFKDFYDSSVAACRPAAAEARK